MAFSLSAKKGAILLIRLAKSLHIKKLLCEFNMLRPDHLTAESQSYVFRNKANKIYTIRNATFLNLNDKHPNSALLLGSSILF